MNIVPGAAPGYIPKIFQRQFLQFLRTQIFLYNIISL